MWGAIQWGFTAWLRNRWVTEHPGPLTGHWVPWQWLYFSWVTESSDSISSLTETVKMGTTMLPPKDHRLKQTGCVRARMLSCSVVSHSLRPDGLDPTWVSCIAGGFFTIWATRETHTECITFFMGRSSRPGWWEVGMKQQLFASPFPT